MGSVGLSAGTSSAGTQEGGGERVPLSCLGAFPCFHFLFATIFSWGLIKDLELFTGCGWLFIWVLGNYLLP